MNSGLAFILMIATLPILLFLVLAFCFVLADSMVSIMDNRKSQTSKYFESLSSGFNSQTKAIKVKIKSIFLNK